MLSLRVPPEISSDGRRVWVNAPVAIARFSIEGGFEVHRLPSEQEEKGECLYCSHRKSTREDWDLFNQKLQDFYGFTVPDHHMPEKLRTEREQVLYALRDLRNAHKNKANKDDRFTHGLLYDALRWTPEGSLDVIRALASRRPLDLCAVRRDLVLAGFNVMSPGVSREFRKLMQEKGRITPSDEDVEELASAMLVGLSEEDQETNDNEA